MNISTLNEKQRFKIIESNQVSSSVNKYLAKKLRNLRINIVQSYEDKILKLMKKRVLEGWCWETTETAIIFFEDNDYIQRGNLKFDNQTLYHHSWICFKFKEKDYVFDPCLSILCEKEIYDKIFEISPLGKVSAKEVKNEILELVTPNENTLIKGNEDENSPMYRNNTEYNVIIKEEKIKGLKAYYHYHRDWWNWRNYDIFKKIYTAKRRTRR